MVKDRMKEAEKQTWKAKDQICTSDQQSGL